MMIFQTFLIISLVIAANYSAKIDSNKSAELSNIDCDSSLTLFINVKDIYLDKFLKQHDLRSYLMK